MRYAAPEHTTAITLSTGPVEVKDGFVTVNDQLGLGDITGLIANGFTPAPVESVEAASTKGKVKVGDTTGGAADSTAG